MNNTMKKVMNILSKIALWLVVAFTVFIMVFTIFTVTTVEKNNRSIFGYNFYIVRSNSMSKSENNEHMKVHFNAGDIIITKAVKNPTNLKEGQIITFYSTVYQETTTHMIHRVEKDSKGNVIGYVTFGTRTGAIDKTSDGKAEAIVEPGLVFGIYSAKLPGAGNFFAYMKTTPGYIVCILVPFMLLIIYNGVNVIRLFRTYKREQNAVIEAERAEIAAQRKQNEEMLRELQALKEQLANRGGDTGEKE